MYVLVKFSAYGISLLNLQLEVIEEESGQLGFIWVVFGFEDLKLREFEEQMLV